MQPHGRITLTICTDFAIFVMLASKRRERSDGVMSKAKYATRFCISCNKETKMEEIGTMEGVENKKWYRCTRCRHSSMFDLDPNKSDSKVIKFNREECVSYTPERIYTVGECIYHTDWDDMGKIMGKAKTSSGGQAIVVSFEKNGSRKLVENLAAEV